MTIPLTNSNLRLQLVHRGRTLGIPTAFLGLVIVISILVALILQRAGLDARGADWEEGFRDNAGVVWALAGFLVTQGVQSVSLTFPLSLALGSTRRAFTLGALISHVVVSAYVAGLILLGLGLELLTDHWFVSAYVFDSWALGAGDPWRLLLIAFAGTLTSLSIGGAFGAVWVRWGGQGPIFVSAGLGLALAVATLLLVPYFGDIVQAFRLWWLLILAGSLILLSACGEYLALRRASVR